MKKSFGTRYPPWFSNALVKIINEKLKFHKKMEIYERESDYDQFSYVMFFKDSRSSNGFDICNLFSDYFQSAFESNPYSGSLTLNDLSSTSDINISSVNLSIATNGRYLSNLDPNKGCGPDGIPSFSFHSFHF